MKIKRNFFERNPVTVARELLGCNFVCKTENGKIVGTITETEAYGDATDLASHARFGITKRNKIMFGIAGTLYVYHIYGIFYLSNIICERENKPSAVLIRAAQITEGEEIAKNNLSKSKFVKPSCNLAIGPGKFSLAFGLTKEHYGVDLTTSQEIYLEQGSTRPDIIALKRIGVDYAGSSKDLLWRFQIKQTITLPNS